MDLIAEAAASVEKLKGALGNLMQNVDLDHDKGDQLLVQETAKSPDEIRHDILQETKMYTGGLWSL